MALLPAHFSSSDAGLGDAPSGPGNARPQGAEDAASASRTSFLSPRAASENLLTDSVEVSGVEPSSSVAATGIRISAAGVYSLSAVTRQRGGRAFQALSPASAVSDLSALRGTVNLGLAQYFGSHTSLLADTNALADDLAAYDPQLYRTFLLLMKMLLEQDPAQTESLLRMTRGLQDMLAHFAPDVSASAATVSVTAVNVEASLQASFGTGLDSGQLTLRVNGTVVNVEARAAGAEAQQGDPLVLDLDGDGIHLRSADEGVTFDLEGSGRSVRTGFIQGDDALLYLDRNGNGVADNGLELFGDQEGHAHGFAELASYDDNQDGVIDDQDGVYHKLRLFQDRNADGVNQAEESLSLDAAGIAAIHLAYEDRHQEDGQGNALTRLAQFIRRDGTRGLVADALLRYCG